MKKTNEVLKAVRERSNLKNKKAITLIALIITIIVLIILAGVATNLTLGTNGIFNKAKYAKSEYLNAKSKEEIELARVTNEIDSSVNSTRNNESGLDIYSTEEKVVGKWIDGRNIYRKVIRLGTFAISSTSASATDAMLPDKLDLVIKSAFYIISETSNDRIYDPCTIYKSGENWYYKEFAGGWSSNNNRIVYLYIEYTKTTDTAQN